MADKAGRTHGKGGVHLIVALLAVYILVTGVWPLIRLFALSFAPGEEGQIFGLMREALSGRAFQRAFWNTLAVASGSVAVSALLGTALALATGLMRLPGRALISFLALSPLLIPSQIMALAWIELMGSGSTVLTPLGLAPAPGTPNPLYSGSGIAWLMGLEHMPLVFIAVRASLSSIPADLVEAARIAGASPSRIARRIVLPLALPAAAAGSVLAFAAAIGNFGIPALLGIPGRFPVLTTLIYQRLNGFGPDVIGRVSAMALVLVLLAAAALLLRQILLRRLAVPLPAGAVFRGFAPGRGKWPILAVLWLALIWLAILPIIALVTTSLVPALGVRFGLDTASLKNFTEAFANPAVRRAFANSFTLAGLAAAICAAISILLGWLAITAKNRPARLLSLLAEAAFVVPGTVLALAIILVYLRPLPVIGVSIYGTGLILLIAYLGRFLPMALRPVEASIAASDPSLDEAARIASAGLLRRIAFVAAPALAPSAIAGGMLIFMTAINELTLSALLWSAGNETVGVQIFSMQYEGNSTGAAALSVMSLLLVGMLVTLADRLGRRLPSGTLPWRTE
ncbi:ABC transporter permease [Paracoccus xiamenensis]|uniref:ABC transporter permease n=1 Tax=Paracoccus xiamenensis TaxID=2714901 RepID=UPI00140B0BF3|nr:iron ABC transporter permease [Paracoccus xiamenensis]NHF74388.1 iron ABC transporter permease [Paracoccus xiamenensis]